MTIRERDEQAERCAVCHQTTGQRDWAHLQTAAECSARLMAESGGTRGCWTPEEHHPYKPGPPVEEADIDRRTLLYTGDDLATAARLWHATLSHHHAGRDCCDVRLAIARWEAVTG
jgi:hypothetical protein